MDGGKNINVIMCIKNLVSFEGFRKNEYRKGMRY